MDLLPKVNNFKVVVRNLPLSMDENDFKTLISKYEDSIKWLKYLKSDE